MSFPLPRGSIENFDRRAERIAHAALGHDELGLRGIGLDLAAQAQYLNVDRAIMDLVVIHPAGLEQWIAREDALWRRQQSREQIEFTVRKHNSLSASRQPPRSQVELEIDEAVGAQLSLPRFRQRWPLGSPQDGADAGKQLA